MQTMNVTSAQLSLFWALQSTQHFGNQDLAVVSSCFTLVTAVTHFALYDLACTGTHSSYSLVGFLRITSAAAVTHVAS